jgi:hypothetical protein
MNIANAARAAAETVQSGKYAKAPSEVQAAVRNASARTGVDFSYLMEKAAAESGYQADCKAETSSATGLYQFIDSTWLSTIKAHGAKYGMPEYAAAVQTRADGRPMVTDPVLRQEIMDLRKDPKVSALMAAEFTKDNQDYLKANTSGKVGPTELYMAHFLGAAGGAKFLNALDRAPDAKAADLFPEAASANRNVFYAKSGEPKTLKQIYDRFAQKFDGVDAGSTEAITDTIRRNDQSDGFATQMPSWSGRSTIANPLSIYQVLALNALETPDEADDEEARRQQGIKRVRDQPVRTDQTEANPLGLGLQSAA